MVWIICLKKPLIWQLIRILVKKWFLYLKEFENLRGQGKPNDQRMIEEYLSFFNQHKSKAPLKN